MIFSYGHPRYTPYVSPDGYRPYTYSGTDKRPKVELVVASVLPIRPFEKHERLTDALFREDREGALDPLNFPGERAQVQGRQIRFMIEQLAARHSISDRIMCDIDRCEAELHSQLDNIRTWPFPGGIVSRRAGDLEKQLLDLSKERWAEDVGCWRDTGRMLGDIMDRWSEYADQSRRARLMDPGL